MQNHLLNVIAYGKELVKTSNKDIDPSQLPRVLFNLLSVESILDRGRPLIPAEELNRDTLGEINQGMDYIRKAIPELMKKMGKEEVTKMLNSEGEEVKIRFVRFI